MAGSWLKAHGNPGPKGQGKERKRVTNQQAAKQTDKQTNKHAHIHFFDPQAPVMDLERKKAQTVPYLAFKLDFQDVLNRFRRQRNQTGAQCFHKNLTVLEAWSKVGNSQTTAPAGADRGFGVAGNNQKQKGNTTCEPSRSGCQCYSEDQQRMISKGSLLGHF